MLSSACLNRDRPPCLHSPHLLKLKVQYFSLPLVKTHTHTQEKTEKAGLWQNPYLGLYIKHNLVRIYHECVKDYKKKHIFLSDKSIHQPYRQHLLNQLIPHVPLTSVYTLIISYKPLEVSSIQFCWGMEKKESLIQKGCEALYLQPGVKFVHLFCLKNRLWQFEECKPGCKDRLDGSSLNSPEI